MLFETEKRLLVVDDDEQIHRLFEFCFSGEYRFDFASTGEEALNLVGQREFPVIVLDLNLSGRSGLELLPAFRKASTHQKIIILTGYSSKESAIRAVNSGVFRYLEKPFTHSQIRQVIEAGFDSYFEERLNATKSPPSSLSELALLGLSRREAQIASHVLKGETNNEIASRLSLSPRTVEKYLESVFSKLKVHSRMKLRHKVRELRAVIE